MATERAMLLSLRNLFICERKSISLALFLPYDYHTFEWVRSIPRPENEEKPMIMAVLLIKKICSLFLILISGIALVRIGMLKKEDTTMLSKISLYLVSPCVIINAFQVEYDANILKGLVTAALVALFIHVVLIVGTTLLGKALSLDSVEKASIIYSNAGNLVIPLVSYMFGEEWVIYSCGYLCVQLFLLWSHGKSMIQEETQIDLKKIFLNVNIISTAVGLLLFLTRIQVPEVLSDFMGSLSPMIGPLSMLICGMLIGGMNMRRVVTYRRVWLVAFFRLILVPTLSVLAICAAGLPSLIENGYEIMLIVLIATMTPSASTITQLATIYDKDAEYASSINVITTLCCIITMPIMVLLYTNI